MQGGRVWVLIEKELQLFPILDNNESFFGGFTPPLQNISTSLFQHIKHARIAI